MVTLPSQSDEASALNRSLSLPLDPFIILACLCLSAPSTLRRLLLRSIVAFLCDWVGEGPCLRPLTEEGKHGPCIHLPMLHPFPSNNSLPARVCLHTPRCFPPPQAPEAISIRPTVTADLSVPAPETTSAERRSECWYRCHRPWSRRSFSMRKEGEGVLEESEDRAKSSSRN